MLEYGKSWKTRLYIEFHSNNGERGNVTSQEVTRMEPPESLPPGTYAYRFYSQNAYADGTQADQPFDYSGYTYLDCPVLDQADVESEYGEGCEQLKAMRKNGWSHCVKTPYGSGLLTCVILQRNDRVIQNGKLIWPLAMTA